MAARMTPKQTYDAAAEAWHSHAINCQGCSLHGLYDSRCEVGEDLLRAENEAWSAYQRAKEGD